MKAIFGNKIIMVSNMRCKNIAKGICWVLVLGLLVSCAGYRQASVDNRTMPESYVVKRGDTLSVIAIRYGLDYREVAAWNQLRSPDLIYPGQRLRLIPPGGTARRRTASPPPRTAARVPASQPAARPVARTVTPSTPARPSRVGVKSTTGQRKVANLTWLWPTQGTVVRGYRPQVPGGKGIQIGGDIGQPVRAASAGEVVYSGSGLPGYGRLIILKHSDTLLSAYGYLGEILVKEGDDVSSGQSIASLGTGQDNQPVLHFEIRKNGDPVNPLSYLPAQKAG